MCIWGVSHSHSGTLFLFWNFIVLVMSVLHLSNFNSLPSIISGVIEDSFKILQHIQGFV